jgi:hypothetical protein
MRIPWTFLAIAALTASCEAPEIEPLIQPGEYVLVKGEIHVCPFFGEFLTEAAPVGESEVKLFDHLISAVGLTEAQVQNELIEAIGEKTGRKPETLRIEVISAEEFLARKSEIDEQISSFYKAIQRCEREREKLEKEKDLGGESKKAVAS